MATAIALTILAAVLMLPMISEVIRVRRPVRINSGATSLRIGLFRHFSLYHVTGVVVDANSHDVITGGSALVDLNNGMVVGPITWTTTQHENIYIRTNGGRIERVHIVNYNFRPPVGHVVSIWNARRGSKYFTTAAINHTAGFEGFNDVQLYEVMKPGVSQIFFVFYVCFMVIPVGFLSVFGGLGLPFVLYFVLLFMYARGVRKTLKRYKKQGLTPIRGISRQEAAHAMA